MHRLHTKNKLKDIVTQNKQKKLKTGLVAVYNVWRRDGLEVDMGHFSYKRSVYKL